GNQLQVADDTLLDFETTTSHDVTVRTTDSGGESFEKTLTIQVSDVDDQLPASFDEQFYLVMNHEVGQGIFNGQFNSAAEHFQTIGQAEGRAGAPNKPSTFNIEFDYRFDTNGFFNDPNRRATLEAAASFWESVIQDEFPNVTAGTEFFIVNPQTGQPETVTLDREIDDILIFVGAKNLVDAVGVTNGNFGEDALPERVSGVNYEPFVSSVSFGSNLAYSVDPTPYDLSDTPSENGGDASLFITTAHEIAHVLGISAGIPIYDARRNNGLSFAGLNATAINNGSPIPLRDSAHQDSIVNTTGLPSLLGNGGGANIFIPTKVDLAILADIGYEFQGFTNQEVIPTSATANGDILLGTDADDNLNGLGGNDTIGGGMGQDTFIFGANSGEDRILDFVGGQDVIQVDASLGFANGTEVFNAPGNFFNGNRTLDGTVIGLASLVVLSPGNTINIFHQDPLTEDSFTVV
ncbi:MAG TPA: hypothetical protein IGS52_11855, partial [Oscillatoriaceae cyanobacterium M33_DOE_052]|nr:hypothetical protein [Oscillatoriaceae cyanobacterium M33_DOE_052]